MPRRRLGADPGFLLVAALLVVRLAWLAPRLLVDDLNLDYPFAAGDAWDWIANGLWFAGEPVRWSARPPLLPWALGGLAAAGWLEWWPVLAQGLWSGTLLVLYRLLRRQWAIGVALAATLVVAASHALNLLSLEVMADLPAACLVLLALAAVIAAAERPAWYLAAGAVGALAALASPVGLVVLPAGAAVVLAGRRLGDRRLWVGAALPVVAMAGWLVVRTALLDGEPPLHELRRLVRPHLDDLDGTLWTAAGVLGWPGLALAAVGAVVAIRRVGRRQDPDGLRLAALVAVALPLAFFAVVYDFPDRRFLAYSALPAAVLIAQGLARISRRTPAAAADRSAAERGGRRRLTKLRPAAVRAVVGTVAVVWAAWPAPGPRSLFLWPFGLYADAGVRATPEGGLRVEPARARLRGRSIEEVAAASWTARVARAEAAQRAVGPAEREARRRARETASAAAQSVDGVLFLDAEVRAADRYRVQSQLGNALGRRVGFVPDDLFAGRWDWLAAAGVEPVAEVAGATLWRIAPPGLGAWLLATQAPPAGFLARAGAQGTAAIETSRPRGEASIAGATPSQEALGASDPLSSDDDRSAARQPPIGYGLSSPRSFPPPSPAEPSASPHAPPAGRDAARRLAATLPGRTRLVALLLPDGPPPPAATWLPFLLDTTELYVLLPADLPVRGRLFEEGVSGSPRRFGPARLTERHWRGEPVAVIDFPPAAVDTPPAPQPGW